MSLRINVNSEILHLLQYNCQLSLNCIQQIVHFEKRMSFDFLFCKYKFNNPVWLIFSIFKGQIFISFKIKDVKWQWHTKQTDFVCL